MGCNIKCLIIAGGGLEMMMMRKPELEKFAGLRFINPSVGPVSVHPLYWCSMQERRATEAEAAAAKAEADANRLREELLGLQVCLLESLE